MFTVMLAGALGAAGVACSGQPDDVVVPSPTPQPSAPTPTPTSEPTWPLTGLPAPDGVSDNPVLVVKVDNTAPARPQVGLSAADLIVQELVEGGMTRLAAMYHSALPDEVSPVRSVRTSDIGLVLPTNGALVASGGAQRVLGRMADAGLMVFTEGASGFSRAADRRAPYNVAVDLAQTITDAADLEPPDEPYLPWADAGDEAPAGTPVDSIAATFSAAHTSTWELDGDRWRQVSGLAAEGDAYEPDTVLVLRVAITDAGYTDPAGNFVPETVLEGTGEALLFTGGELVEGEWSKSDPESPFELTDGAGDDLLVPPGRTWIELVPEDGDVTWTER